MAQVRQQRSKKLKAEKKVHRPATQAMYEIKVTGLQESSFTLKRANKGKALETEQKEYKIQCYFNGPAQDEDWGLMMSIWTNISFTYMPLQASGFEASSRYLTLVSLPNDPGRDAARWIASQVVRDHVWPQYRLLLYTQIATTSLKDVRLPAQLDVDQTEPEHFVIPADASSST